MASTRKPRRVSKEMIYEVWQRHDRDGKGKLHFEDVVHVLEELGGGLTRSPRSDVATLFRDVNGSDRTENTITVKPFVRWCVSIVFNSSAGHRAADQNDIFHLRAVRLGRYMRLMQGQHGHVLNQLLVKNPLGHTHAPTHDLPNAAFTYGLPAGKDKYDARASAFLEYSLVSQCCFCFWICCGAGSSRLLFHTQP